MEPIKIYSLIQPAVQKEIDDKILAYANQAKFNVAQIPAHTHNGVDSGIISADDLDGKVLYLPITLEGTSAATATNYGVFFIAPFPCTISGVREAHQTAGTDGGAVTLNLEKLTGTQALNSGITLLSTAINLKGTINTVLNASLSSIPSDLNLAVGDRIALKDTGTLTTVAGVSLMIKINY